MSRVRYDIAAARDQMFALRRAGHSCAQIAAAVGIRKATVQYHVKGIPCPFPSGKWNVPPGHGRTSVPSRVDIVGDGTALVHLQKGVVTIVDEADVPLVSPYRWSFWASRKVSHLRYVRSKIGGKGVQLHRLLVQPAPGLLVDHINGDTLDNRRANLRTCDHFGNAANSRYPRNRTGYRGVTINKATGLFVAQIGIGGRSRCLGYFRDAKAAAIARDAAAAKHQGEFAVFNFPEMYNLGPSRGHVLADVPHEVSKHQPSVGGV